MKPHMKKSMVKVSRRDNGLMYIFTESDRGKFERVYSQFKHSSYDVFINHFGTEHPNEFKQLLDTCTDGAFSSDMGDLMERLDVTALTNFVFGLCQMNGLSPYDKMSLIKGNASSLFVFSTILNR